MSAATPSAPPAKEDKPTVIVVVGAPGEEEYGKHFAEWAAHWEKASREAGAREVTIGLQKALTGTDRERLQRALLDEPKSHAAELWLVLIGHGTFDGKQAKFNLQGPDLSAAELAEWLKPFQRPLAVINTASSSGPFLNALSAPGRVVITATRSGHELNYARFGQYLSEALLDLQADLDKDGQVSLLEAYLGASHRVAEFYEPEGRLATEHALLDDNGDGLGTPADWFRGVRAIKKADKGASVDGHRAHQFHLIRSEQERRMPATVRAQRDELEMAVIKLREAKAGMKEDDYYRRLENLLLKLARLYQHENQAQAQPAGAADTVLLGGKILTVDARDSVQQALAIRGEHIMAVGSDAQIERFIGGQTQVIRLNGKTVIPGLIESHCHAIGVGQAVLTETYAELSSIAEVQDWVRRQAKTTPPGAWIRVPRNEITRIKERRHPTTAELDAACDTHPVVFTAATKHAFNSLGWRRLGLTRETPSMPGIEIIRDDRGNPRLLKGGDGLLRKEMPPPNYSTEQTLAALRPVLRRYNEAGITSIFERASNREGYELYRALRERGQLTARVTVTFRQQMTTAAQVEQFVRELGLKPREGDDWVKAGPLKITVDGGIHWGSTYLSEPYGDKRARFYALGDPNYRGDLRYTVEQMKAVFGAGHQLGWQMSCHITGDAGVDRVLDALEAADTSLPVKDRRFTLIHAYFPTPQSVQRAHKLGVCVDTQPYLYYRDSDALAEIYAPRWAEQLIGLGAWFHGGVPVAINADHMIGLDPDHAMNSFNPFLALYIAVSRRNDHGRVHGAHQKLTRLEALRCVTANAAYLSFDEQKTGSLEPGKLADLVVLDRDYLACPEEEIRQIKPLRTMVGGRPVYSSLPSNSTLQAF